MPEETLLLFEQVQTRAEIADRLRSLADGLDEDGPLTLIAEDQRVTVTPPDCLEFELEIGREYDDESEEQRSSELSIEVEIEWDEADAGSSEERSAGSEERTRAERRTMARLT